jgi:hypothetical protein
MNSVPVIDLTPWFGGDAEDRAKVAARVDAALREIGFLGGADRHGRRRGARGERWAGLTSSRVEVACSSWRSRR